jgi:hypothetical protein
MKKLTGILLALAAVAVGCTMDMPPPGGQPIGSNDLAALGTGGGGGGLDLAVPIRTFSADVKPIFMKYGCARSGCHSGGDAGVPKAGLDLSSMGYAHLVNVASSESAAKKRVAPGDPSASYLLDKLMGTQSVGAQMPKIGGPLTAAELSVVQAWIQDGASM